MLQKTYSIYSDDLGDEQLFIEVGKNHLACWCKKPEQKKICAFEFFQCDDYDASGFENLINQVKLHSRLLTLDVSATTITWTSEKKLIIPAAINADENFIRDNFILMYGSDDTAKFIVRNYEDCLIITNVEKYLYNAASRIFPKSEFQPACQIVKPDEDSIQLLFYPNYFSVIVYKDDKLQFFQTKYFNNSEEVLYTLLNIITQYQLEKNIKIIAGGFIDVHSKLYNLLYQYLEGLELGSVDEALFTSPEFSDYPAHYFLPYVNYLL